MVGHPPPFLLSCFISGLNPEVRREVMALQPISLLQATALAKLQEEKLRDRTNQAPRSFPQPRPFVPQASNTSSKTTPFVKRTPAEMAFRREKRIML